MSDKKLTREEAIEKIAKKLAVNGWSTIYSYVENHASEDELIEVGMDENIEDE
jgi:hypothetical protein